MDHVMVVGGQGDMLEETQVLGQARWSAPDPARHLTQGWLGGIVLAVAVGAAYFLAARLSLGLLMKPEGVAVFWPAAGISSGTLIALGPRVRWPVALGAIIGTIPANLLGDRNVSAAAVFAVSNAAEALIVAGLIQYCFGAGFSLNRLRRVLGLFAAVGVGTAISGIGGTIGYKLFHSPTTPMLTTWLHWFSSDAVGIVCVAPVLIGLVAAVREPPRRSELIEGVSALILLVAMTGVIILLPAGPWRTVVPSALLFPMLLWLAARSRPVFAAAGAFLVSFTIVWTTIFGIGHFGDTRLPIDHRILQAQAFILTVALLTLVLAALFCERSDSEERLGHSNLLLKRERDNRVAIFNTVVDGIITIDHSGMIVAANPAAARLFGYAFEEMIGRNVKMLMPEPYNREHDTYLANYLKTGQAKVIGIGREVVGLRKNGSTFPMELAVGETAAAGRSMFIGVVRDITVRKRAEELQGILLAELNHRVKNILAEVAMVASSTRLSSRSIDGFLRSLNGRIQSMAAAHTLLSESGWQNTELAVLIGNQLAYFSTGKNLTIAGKDVILNSAETHAVARVLHELATNAAKYGALSSPGGQVSVTWDCKPNGHATTLVLVWRERDGPPVASEIHPSYGSNLIRNLIPHELGGTVDLVFARDGVNCTMEFPIARGALVEGVTESGRS
jgi:PAS domain S-box-containing protein